MHRLYQLKKVQKLLLATNNPGKFRELKEILPKKIKYFKPKDFRLREPIENGKTFKSNAKIKSLYAAKRTGLVCISDDSGLEVDALSKKPGIYSARWAGPTKNFDIAIKKVFNLLNKKKKLNSKARFICAISIAFPDGKSFEFQGKVEGHISFPARGKKGFGYDPIFIPKGEKKTFAQIGKLKKNKISHRYDAFMKIKKYFKFS
ncbi:MAG: RdgB/HAM1 family non-canonical purine NTP pyrophosphatase [Pelagibacteraceae bacterium]